MNTIQRNEGGVVRLKTSQTDTRGIPYRVINLISERLRFPSITPSNVAYYQVNVPSCESITRNMH